MASFVLHRADLVTRHISKILPFYRDVLGLVTRQPDGRTLTVHASAGAPAVIAFKEDPSAAQPQARVAGLFHIALLVPDRVTLAAALARLVERRQPLEGLSDHGVSEAIYLSDPDGNGMEIYRDRPREEWPMNGHRVAMGTLPLDHRGLLRELSTPPAAPPLAKAKLGHMHLQVSDLAESQEFYTGKIGLEVRQDTYPEALFMAADGYHHHVAINTWGHPTRRPAGAVRGLVGFHASSARTEEPRTLIDPDGIAVSLQPLAAVEAAAAPQ